MLLLIAQGVHTAVDLHDARWIGAGASPSHNDRLQLVLHLRDALGPLAANRCLRNWEIVC